MRRKMKLATSVSNTIVGRHKGGHDLPVEESSILELYKVFFDNNGSSWIDITSVNELSGPRFRSIEKPKIKNPDHRIVLVKHSTPMINFTIIDCPKDAGGSEIIFGWDYFSQNQPDTLFISQDEDLISAYRAQFNNLKGYSLGEISMDYSKENSRRIEGYHNFADKAGSWVTISYRKHTDKPNELVSVATLTIRFNRNSASISGRVFWREGFSPDGNPIERISHVSEGKVSYTDTKMLIEYTQPNSGVCIYNFRKDGLTEVIDGYFQNSTQSHRTEISGQKIRPDTHTGDNRYAIRVLASKEKLRVAAKELGMSINWNDFDFDFDPRSVNL